MMRTILLGLTACAIALAAQPAAAQTHSKPMIAELPQFRPLPITDASKPFRSRAADMAKVGYVEEEYVMSGQARVYDWAPGGGVKVIAGPSPFATRVLVQRPRDPARFSGNVEVEIINASPGVDNTGGISDYMIRSGDVWVGVTSKGITAVALKNGDPQRYADLNWKNPLPPEKTCKDPTITPMWVRSGAYSGKVSESFVETEDGLFFDMFAQIGAFLKSPGRERLLPGFKPPKLFATGVSQSGLVMRTWINALHPNLRAPGGGPIYDGYLEIVGAQMQRINQCADDILPWDTRNRITVPTDAAVVNMFSEADMWKAVYSRQPDAIHGRTGLVTYEMAGSAHGGVLWPRRGIEAAALHNLQAWVNEGVAPPPGNHIETILITIQRDEHGNAKGGIRSPYLEAPYATYIGDIAPMSSGPGGKQTFPPEELKKLYPYRGLYLEKFDAAADRLVQQRFLLPDGAAEMKADARANAPIPQ